MRIRIVVVSLALLLLAPAAAFASLAGEQRQGQQLIAQLQSGARRCNGLSAEDFDHIGEYVMWRELGATSVHQAMNNRMTLMMGEQAESRMHQQLGASFVGCRTPVGGNGTYGYGGYGYGGMMGRGMMGGGYDNGRSGPMMSSSASGWMMNGAWRNMTRQDWQRLQRQLLGANRGSGHHDWSALAIAAVTLAATVLASALAILLIRRRPFKRPSATPAT